MISFVISRLVSLTCGILYPAYASYKSVKAQNVRDSERWLIYWTVFAVYRSLETITDILLAFWFPFYYELKILFVLWLVYPATTGSVHIFSKVINPRLGRHEVLIDSFIASLWDLGYDAARNIGEIGAQTVDRLLEIASELFRRGQITFIQSHPVSEAAQNGNNHRKPTPNNAENLSDLTVDHLEQPKVDEIIFVENRRPSATEYTFQFELEGDEHMSIDDNTKTNGPEYAFLSESEEIPIKKKQTTRKRSTKLRERKKTTKNEQKGKK